MKKIIVLLPDGVGLRNFVHTDFYIEGSKKFEVKFLNLTPFELTELGINQIKPKKIKNHFLTEIYKNARRQIELNLFKERYNDDIYKGYQSIFKIKNLKTLFKVSFTRLLIKIYHNENGLKIIRERIKKIESKTNFYKECIELLSQEKPDFVFCTNQRPSTAIAPIIAAQHLGIPTGTFIFSWDNLPKATMVIEPDYYFVWSEHMKGELLKYYNYVDPSKVYITGTPQFENHLDSRYLTSREQFMSEFNLDSSKRYLCYSGDDITTSPNDQLYIKDIIKAVRNLNEKGYNLGIIFRRCPVDFRDRYDKVIQENKDILFPINPSWKKIKDSWNTILPLKEDLRLLVNTTAHTELVINVASSMVFDFVIHKKPCLYLNYEVQNKDIKEHSILKIYKYVHFRSMKEGSVIWMNNLEDIEQYIIKGLNCDSNIINNAQSWFEKINVHPIENSSVRIVNSINTILEAK